VGRLAALTSPHAGIGVPSRESRQNVSRARTRSAPRGRLITVASLLAGILIAGGWYWRDERYLVAEEGLGYLLGVVGLACMCALLLYSCRKRMRILRSAGRISVWFQVHMLLGLFGPVAILYHCNFKPGSLNSNVALLCALVVAASGVVGRVIYTRIHHGLSDRRLTLDEVRGDVERAKQSLEGEGPVDGILVELAGFEAHVSRPQRGFIGSAWSYVSLGRTCRSAKRRAVRSLRGITAASSQTASGHRQLERAVGQYVAAVRRVETLRVHERFFALWHVLHLPLAFLLYTSAAVHVVAVHMY
jgi:hypothetical protein